MNKRQRKKLCCPKCGNRKIKWMSICYPCNRAERNLMRDVIHELAEINPIFGSFIKGSGMFSYAGLF